MNIGHFFTALIASCMAFSSIVGSQGGTGRATPVEVVLWYAGGWFLLFAIAASLPSMFTRAGRKRAGTAIVAFGAGGGIAGGLVGLLLITNNLGGSPSAVFVDAAIPFVLPWAAGIFIMVFRRP